MPSGSKEAFVFMKVGEHAGEPFDSILKRKNHEFERAGKIFWGYGGTCCHPLMQVQPFARLYARKQGEIYLFMESINSKANPDLEPAEEYSMDGANWIPLPEGIRVTGSRYAMVLGKIEVNTFEINMDDYIVGVGLSRGKKASDYLQGRIDKGCLTLGKRQIDQRTLSKAKTISFAAKLVEPYAVLLR